MAASSTAGVTHLGTHRDDVNPGDAGERVCSERESGAMKLDRFVPCLNGER